MEENMDWKNIYINSNLIQRDTGKAVLFAMPKNGKYAGWSFWHPAKCVHGIVNRRDIVRLGYTDDWDFKLVKKDNSMEITVEQFEQAFEKMDANIRPWVDMAITKELDIDIINYPEHMDPVENPVACRELVDD